MHWEIDKTWTLFLDRDGVINVRDFNGYITKEEDFVFIDGVLEALKGFSEVFGRIVVVTNQQCIGKEIIPEDTLNQIHAKMISEIENAGGRIDKVYFAPQLASEISIYRKPNSGMADLAQADFPEIDFKKSIMVGDSISDLQFGKNKGMKTVFISDIENELSDYTILNLRDLKFSEK